MSMATGVAIWRQRCVKQALRSLKHFNGDSRSITSIDVSRTGCRKERP